MAPTIFNIFTGAVNIILELKCTVIVALQLNSFLSS